MRKFHAPDDPTIEKGEIMTHSNPIRSGSGALAVALLMGLGAALPSTLVSAAPVQPTAPAAAEVAAGERHDISTEAMKAWRRIDEATADQRAAALEAGEEFLSAVDRDLNALGDGFADAGDAAGREWAKRRAVLASAREDFSAMVDGLREDSGDAWDSVKSRMKDAYRTLADGIPDAWEELSRPTS